jgi:hypothetical protein
MLRLAIRHGFRGHRRLAVSAAMVPAISKLQIPPSSEKGILDRSGVGRCRSTPGRPAIAENCRSEPLVTPSTSANRRIVETPTSH